DFAKARDIVGSRCGLPTCLIEINQPIWGDSAKQIPHIWSCSRTYIHQIRTLSFCSAKRNVTGGLFRGEGPEDHLGTSTRSNPLRPIFHPNNAEVRRVGRGWRTTVVDKLASSLKRRDEAPNVKLAQSIVQKGDRE